MTANSDMTSTANTMRADDEKLEDLTRDDQETRHICLNCGTQLAGNYCQACGQKAHIHTNLGAFWHDFIHGVLHFEGRAWRTLPMLAWRPGELTRRYIEGERKRFISPMAMFLFSIFLMFAVFQLSGIKSPADIGVPDRSASNGISQTAPGRATSGRVSENFMIGSAREGTALIVRKTGINWLDKGLEKWRDEPSLMLYKFQANSYKFSWLLILISTPFMWLLFAGRRRFNAYHHVVFVTYSISFVTILMVILSTLYSLGLPTIMIALAAVLLPPIHIFADLRGAYGLSVFAAFWRLLALLLFIMVAVALFLQLLWLIGIAG